MKYLIIGFIILCSCNKIALPIPSSSSVVEIKLLRGDIQKGENIINLTTGINREVTKYELFKGDNGNFLCLLSSIKNNGDTLYQVIDKSPYSTTYYMIGYYIKGSSRIHFAPDLLKL